MKRWVSNFSFDFRGNQKLVEKLVTACRSTFVNNEKALGESIIRSLEEQLKVFSNFSPKDSIFNF